MQGGACKYERFALRARALIVVYSCDISIVVEESINLSSYLSVTVSLVPKYLV